MNKKLIPITLEDLKKIVYFTILKFEGDPLHRQGTSSKRDLIGGYIDRWFNKVGESVLFNHLLKNKNYKALTDYFIYRNDSDKNAPDILGLEKSGRVIPFAKYSNGTWKMISGMPQIEIKVVRKDQFLLGIRDTQLVDDYYIFIESDLDQNYLTAIFDEDLFNEKYFSELVMSKDFIDLDEASQLVTTKPLAKKNNIGTMRLIGTYDTDELKRLSQYCRPGMNPFYLRSVENLEREINVSDSVLESINQGYYKYEYEGESYLPISLSSKEEIKIYRKNKTNLYIHCSKEVNINGQIYKSGLLKLNFSKFERSSSWNEYIATKNILEIYGTDITEKLISNLDNIANSS